MAGESLVGPRRGLAGSLTGPLSELNPDVCFGYMAQGEFISAIRSRGVVSEPLDGDTSRFFTISVPYHWRFLVPSAVDQSKLEVIRFGISEDGEASGPGNKNFEIEEAAIDDQLEAFCHFNLSVSERCNSIRDDIARIVNMAGRPFFAGIERRRPLTASYDSDKRWSQLIFSSWLLKAQDKLAKSQQNDEEKYKKVPPALWYTQELESTPAHRHIVAVALALAALRQTVDPSTDKMSTHGWYDTSINRGI